MPAKSTASMKEDTPVRTAALVMFSISSSTLYMGSAAPARKSAGDRMAEGMGITYFGLVVLFQKRLLVKGGFRMDEDVLEERPSWRKNGIEQIKSK